MPIGNKRAYDFHQLQICADVQEMQQDRQIDIAVIGGGAKAAALAAKASALRRARVANIRITIFEKSEIGAHWSGKGGYTDGKQRLCTPAERDVGFPYSSIHGERVDDELYSNFSWASFLRTKRQHYSAWVDGGRKAPMHEDFAKYLAWVVKRSEAVTILTKVEGLRPVDGKWIVQHRGASGALGNASDISFDGVVVSSPGPARRVRVHGDAGSVFDGDDFWKRLKEVAKILKRSEIGGQVAIVGAGGTAAAVLAWLTRNGYKDREIVMVANQAALFTRGDSVFENRLFSDEEAWKALSLESRKEFAGRLNRGVVWSTVMEQVSSASRLVFLDGRATAVRSGNGGPIEVSVRRGDGKNVKLRPVILVDASGFEPWWFLKLIRALPAKSRRSSDFADALQKAVGPNLDFRGSIWSLPRLHAPVVSSAIGPGFGSLMSLGGMADRVLTAYVSR